MARMSPKGSQNTCLAFMLLGSGQFHKENLCQRHPIPSHSLKPKNRERGQWFTLSDCQTFGSTLHRDACHSSDCRALDGTLGGKSTPSLFPTFPPLPFCLVIIKTILFKKKPLGLIALAGMTLEGRTCEFSYQHHRVIFSGLLTKSSPAWIGLRQFQDLQTLLPYELGKNRALCGG